jgi:hypothetical protein
VCSWLCLFLKESRLDDPTQCELKPEPMSPELKEVFDETYHLAEMLDVCPRDSADSTFFT